MEAEEEKGRGKKGKMALRTVKYVIELTEKICEIWKKECKKHEKKTLKREQAGA